MDKHSKMKRDVKRVSTKKESNCNKRKVINMPATAQICQKTSREELMQRAKALHHSIASRMKSAGFTNEQVEKDVKEVFLDASKRNSDTDSN